MLKQSSRTVADFAVEFCILATKYDWNAPALKAVFYNALNEKIKDELALRKEPETLNELISLSIKLDNSSRERARYKGLMLSFKLEHKAEQLNDDQSQHFIVACPIRPKEEPRQ